MAGVGYGGSQVWREMDLAGARYDNRHKDRLKIVGAAIKAWAFYLLVPLLVPPAKHMLRRWREVAYARVTCVRL